MTRLARAEWIRKKISTKNKGREYNEVGTIVYKP